MVPGRRFSPRLLEAVVRDALCRAGVTDDMAQVEAAIMVDADLCGVPSHGVVMLPRLLQGLADGRASARPTVRVVRDQGATCVLDGDRGPGRYVAAMAMDRAVEKARQHGLGACLAVRTTHWGRAHAYAVRAARAGMVGFCTTNAIPTLAVPGVLAPVLGNNPIAIAVPRSTRDEPVVIDLALTQAALGKIATRRREGLPVPANWGLDTAGRPTEDPAAILQSGLLLPIGEHKGIGLAVVMELLTAALSAGPFGHEIARADATGLDPGASKLFLALDVEALGDREAFEARVDAMLAYLSSVGGERGVLAPGERGWRARRENEREGVPLHPDIVAQLRSVGVILPDE